MDFKLNGKNISIDPARLSNEQLAQATQEFAVSALDRGLEIPAFAGLVAVDGTSEGKVSSADAKEVIVNQLDTSFQGYLTHVEQINKNRSEEDKIEPGDVKTQASEFEAWFSEAEQTYVAESMTADPELSYTLCSVVNETVTPDEIIEDAIEFGEKQPYKTTVYSKLITQYTAQEVSGTNPKNGNKFKFVLVPSKFTPGLNRTVIAQKDKQAQSQKDAPFLGAPTLLVCMSFLHTRRAMGDKLIGIGTNNRTYMCNYGMKDKPIDESGRCVPMMFVGVNGKLVISGSIVPKILSSWSVKNL